MNLSSYSVSNSGRDSSALQFWYGRNVTRYISNFFLTLLVIAYALLWLNKHDTQWAFSAAIFTGVCLFCLMISGLKWGRILLTGARVFHQLQTPVTLWQKWQRAILIRATLPLLILFFGIKLLELDHQDLLPTSALLAVASLSLSLGFSLSLALNNYLNKWCYLLFLAFSLYIIYLCGSKNIQHDLMTAWHLHLPILLLWPILIVSTLMHWSKPPSNKGKTFFLQLKELALISHLRHFYLRHTALGSAHSQPQKVGLRTSDKVLKAMGLFWFILLSPMLIVDWQASVSLPHLLSIAAFAVFSSSYIVVKDLHWRFLLLPGHFQQGRIATHLLFSSLVYHGCWALMLLLALYGLKMLLTTSMPLDHTASISLFSIALLALELLSAFCVGLLIRGSEKPSRTIFYLFLICLMVAAGIASYFYLHKQNPAKAAVFTMNTAYVLTVITIGVGALIYANQRWTRERLLKFL